MSFMNMDEFLQQLSGNSEAVGGNFDSGQLEAVPVNVTGTPVDINGDNVADGWGYDCDGNGKIDMVQYDFNHDGVVDAVGIDTTGNGVFDTIYYDFNHDGMADAAAFDSTGDGRIDTMNFLNSGVRVFSDMGFTIPSAWEAGIARVGAVGVDTEGVLADQAGQLGLNGEEHEWAKKAVNQEEKTPEMAKKEVSFGASATCIGGTTGCLGCAGILLDRKYACKTGACTGGVEIR